MIINIPLKISDLEIYKLTKSILSQINFEVANLDEFEISEFNKLLRMVGIEPSLDTSLGISKVFSNKGSVESIYQLSDLLNIGLELVEVDTAYEVTLIIPELSDLSFLPNLTNCISYLLFYSRIKYQLDMLSTNLTLIRYNKFTVLSEDIVFHSDILN